MKKWSLWLGIVFCALWLSGTKGDTLSSPSKGMEVTIHPSDDNCLFTLTKDNSDIAKVQLGLSLTTQQLLFDSEQSIEIQRVEQQAEYNEYLLTKGKNQIQVRVRVFDNALAFRYESIEKTGTHLNKERSAWTLPAETTIWYFERKNEWKLKSYAGTWEQASLSELTRSTSSVQGTPIVFQLPSGHYGFISEAALEEYSGMRLEIAPENTLKVNFTEGTKGFDLPALFKSPWRVFFVCDDLNALVNQTVIKRLAPRPADDLYADSSYIVPGKCAWRWFAKGTGTPEEERQVIDAAAEMNFTYSLIDDGWKNWKNCWKEAENLVSYAKDKGVRLLFWQHSKPLCATANHYENMRNFLDSIASIGAAGVKVDFMDSEAKPLIDFEIKLLQECAKRQLIVNFHGCQAPSGEAYTYPNELTREGIRGIELNKMREGYIPSYHNAALPFTRLMVGHGDYTPLTFTVPGETTFAHQLATLVCFDSPLQTIAEDPELLLHDNHVNTAAEFIRDVPTVWDEVCVLPQSEIAKLAVIAKRKGADWYVGVLNGEAEEKVIELDLTPFMRHPVNVEAYLDDLDSDKVLLSMEGHRKGMLKRKASIPFKTVKNAEDLKRITLAGHGGAVIVLHNGIQ